MTEAERRTEGDYRGWRFRDGPADLKGNNDLLTLARPELVRDIHARFLSAGADMIESNSFNSSAPSQGDYRLEGLVGELKLAAAKLARSVADEFWSRDGQPRFVAGALGPTNRTASLSPSVSDPAFRNITFHQLVATYPQAAH